MFFSYWRYLPVWKIQLHSLIKNSIRQCRGNLILGMKISIGISQTKLLPFITPYGRVIILTGKIILYLLLSGSKEDLEDPVSSDVSIKLDLFISSTQMEQISQFKVYGTGTILDIYFAQINQSVLDSQLTTMEKLLITLLTQQNISWTFYPTFWKITLGIWERIQFIWQDKVMQVITSQPLLKRFWQTGKF